MLLAVCCRATIGGGVSGRLSEVLKIYVYICKMQHNNYVYLPIVSNKHPTNFDSKMIEIKMIKIKIGTSDTRGEAAILQDPPEGMEVKLPYQT